MKASSLLYPLLLVLLSTYVNATSSGTCPPVQPILYAAQNLNAGTAYITANSTGVYIRVVTASGWTMTGVQAYVGNHPPSRGTNPDQLPFKASFPETTTYTLVAPYPTYGWKCGTNVALSIHADMLRKGAGSGGSDCHESGWGFGENKLINAWGWYCNYLICCPSSSHTPPPPPPPAPCNLPGGGTMPSGTSRLFYSTASAGCGQTCYSQTRTCTNGVLTGTFTYASCTASPCRSCTGPDGSTIAHTASKTYYQKSSVACGRTCTSQTRTCTDGTLSGSYLYGSCTVNSCSPPPSSSSCTLPGGGTLANGQKKTYYQASTVPCGQTCKSEKRTCNSGVLSGSYTASSCSVTTCLNCVGPDGVTIPHATSKTYYSTTTVACGNACPGESRYCYDGALTGTFTIPSCTVSPCRDCTGLDGQPMPHGSSVARYPSRLVACGSTCDQEIRNCVDGKLSGSATYTSCLVDYCPPPPPTEPGPCDKHAFFGTIPSLFNVFVLGDFYCHDSDTEGRLAAGQNIYLNNYAIGCRLYTRELCIDFGEITCENITARGDWMSTIVAGNQFKGFNLEVKSGNIAYGAYYNNDITANFQRDCVLTHSDSVIDFEGWGNYLTALSDKIAQLYPSGKAYYNTVTKWVTLLGTMNPELDVFVLRGWEFCGSWQTSHFNILNVHPNATVLINVLGDFMTCGKWGAGEDYDMHHVLFNFPQATRFTMQDVNWRGSVLAPRALIANATGQINGQVFAKAWIADGTTCMQQNWEPFEGCIPDYCRNIDPIPYCTAQQTAWDIDCTANETGLGCTAETSFFDCFSYDGITIGCPENDGFYITLSNITAVRDFFPQLQSTSLGPLTESLLDPTTSPAGAAAAELLSLTISSGLDTCKADNMGLCSTFNQLYVCDLPSTRGSCSAFAGKTIGEIIGLANRVIGQCQVNTEYTVGEVYDCLILINDAFTGCKTVVQSDTSQSFGYCECGQTVCDATPYSLKLATNPPEEGSTFVNHKPVVSLASSSAIFSVVVVLAACLIALLM